MFILSVLDIKRLGKEIIQPLHKKVYGRIFTTLMNVGGTINLHWSSSMLHQRKSAAFVAKVEDCLCLNPSTSTTQICF